MTRLSGYLPNIWQETLDALTTAAPVQWVYNGRPAGVGLLTNEQNQIIVRRDLAFSLLDQEFQWMYPLSGAAEEVAAIWQKVLLEAGPDVPFSEKLAEVEAEKAKRGITL